MAVLSAVLTKLLGSCGIRSVVSTKSNEAKLLTLWPPPKETPAARAVKFPRLCLEFFLVRRMRRCARRMMLAASIWAESQLGSSGCPQSVAITRPFLSVIGQDTLDLVSIEKNANIRQIYFPSHSTRLKSNLDPSPTISLSVYTRLLAFGSRIPTYPVLAGVFVSRLNVGTLTGVVVVVVCRSRILGRTLTLALSLAFCLS